MSKTKRSKAMQIQVTKKIDVKQEAGWPQEVPVAIYDKHYDIGAKVWIVYVRDRAGAGYDYFVGQVLVTAIQQRRDYVDGQYGMVWRYSYTYLVTGLAGERVIGDIETWVPSTLLFDSKNDAITNLRGAVVSKLDKDRKAQSDRLEATEAAITRVKDEAIELQYGAIEIK